MVHYLLGVQNLLQGFHLSLQDLLEEHMTFQACTWQLGFAV